MRIRHLPDKGLKSVVLKMITKFGRMKEGTTKTSAKRKHKKEHNLATEQQHPQFVYNLKVFSLSIKPYGYCRFL